MKLLMITITAALLTLAIQGTVMASDPTSLAEVSAIVADALATNDTLMLQRHLKTYEDEVAGPDGKKISKSDFLDVLKKRKERTERVWRDIRENKILPEDIKIMDVQLQELDPPDDGKYMVFATVFPVFKIEGELTPFPMAMLHFVAINGKWKFIW